MVRQEAFSARPLLSRAAAAMGVVASVVGVAHEAEAQTSTNATGGPRASSADNTLLIPEVSVQGAASSNMNDTQTGISRLPGTVRETPQIVNVVPQEVIQQQHVTTLQQALRNVPGITLSTGEGNGGLNGDQFRIRGLAAKGDIYIDGLHDFGAYVRDSFNTDSVQVMKGPTGEAFGAGNVGGVINQSSKRAHLGNSLSADQSVGSGALYRTTVDGNYQVNDTTAVRLNGMWHNEDVADRDHTSNDRWGVAAALGMGLGTDTTWNLGYQYLHVDRTADYGVPMMAGSDGIFRPMTEYGLKRSTSYTRSFNHDISDSNNLTSSFVKKLNDYVTFSNDTRFAYYERNMSNTAPAACSGTCASSFLAGGNPSLSYGAGGGIAYKQAGWGIQNVTNGRFDFETGPFRHKANIGLDISYQRDTRSFGSYVNRVNNQTVLDPQYEYGDVSIGYPASGHRVATATDFGAYMTDRMWLTEQWSLSGSLRWDQFESTFNTAANTDGVQSQEASRLSPSGSVIFEPWKNTNFYASFARSYKPVGTDVSSQVANATTTGEVPSNASDLRPERSDLYEVGAKMDFLNGRLGLTGAVFQINKKNSYTYDEDGDVVTGFSDSGEGRRIRGTEIGLTGKITSAWSVLASYAYLTGKVTDSSTGASIGNQAPQVAKNNVAIWTAYDLGTLLPAMEGDLKIGGGVQYASSYWADSANTARIPHNISLDAMISYQYDKYRVSLNGYNLTNHLNYESAFNASRAVPTSGRTILANVGVTF